MIDYFTFMIYSMESKSMDEFSVKTDDQGIISLKKYEEFIIGVFITDNNEIIIFINISESFKKTIETIISENKWFLRIILAVDNPFTRWLSRQYFDFVKNIIDSIKTEYEDVINLLNILLGDMGYSKLYLYLGDNIPDTQMIMKLIFCFMKYLFEEKVYTRIQIYTEKLKPKCIMQFKMSVNLFKWIENDKIKSLNGVYPNYLNLNIHYIFIQNDDMIRDVKKKFGMIINNVIYRFIRINLNILLRDSYGEKYTNLRQDIAPYLKHFLHLLHEDSIIMLSEAFKISDNLLKMPDNLLQMSRILFELCNDTCVYIGDDFVLEVNTNFDNLELRLLYYLMVFISEKKNRGYFSCCLEQLNGSEIIKNMFGKCTLSCEYNVELSKQIETLLHNKYKYQEISSKEESCKLKSENKKHVDKSKKNFVEEESEQDKEFFSFKESIDEQDSDEFFSLEGDNNAKLIDNQDNLSIDKKACSKYVYLLLVVACLIIYYWYGTYLVNIFCKDKVDDMLTEETDDNVITE